LDVQHLAPPGPAARAIDGDKRELVIARRAGIRRALVDLAFLGKRKRRLPRRLLGPDLAGGLQIDRVAPDDRRGSTRSGDRRFPLDVRALTELDRWIAAGCLPGRKRSPPQWPVPSGLGRSRPQ